MSSASLSDSEVPGRYFTRVRERAYGFLSIESVKVKINDKSKGPRQIYGEIKVDTHALGRCIYFYHRNGDEAEPVPDVDDDADGFNLTLCGPNHCIDDDFRVIAVALYEDGPQPFFSGEFSLCHEMFGWGKYQEPITLKLDFPNDSGAISLCFTRICYSIPAQFEFFVDNGQIEGELAVWGTIRLKYSLLGTSDGAPHPNWVSIFRSGGSPVSVMSGTPIPVPRSVFVMPVECGFATIYFDLQVQKHGEVEIHNVKGEAEIVINGAEKMYIARELIVENTNLKRKHASGSSSDEMRIKLLMTPIHDFCPEGDRDLLIH